MLCAATFSNSNVKWRLRDATFCSSTTVTASLSDLDHDGWWNTYHENVLKLQRPLCQAQPRRQPLLQQHTALKVRSQGNESTRGPTELVQHFRF